MCLEEEWYFWKSRVWFGVIVMMMMMIRGVSAEECCSWNFKDCGDSTWCNERRDQCENDCNGYYIDTALQSPTCTARWEGCTRSDECCGLELEPQVVCAYAPWNNFACGLDRVDVNVPCCTWDFVACGTEPWCNENANHCDQCTGFWRNVAGSQDGCLARYQGLGDENLPSHGNLECCAGLTWVHFMEDGYVGCGLAHQDGPPVPVVATPQGFCCSWNVETCMSENWCNAHSIHCEGACNGFWVDVDANEENCVGRHQWTEDPNNCCGDLMTLVQYNDPVYVGCGIAGIDGDRIIVSSPTQNPTSQPTFPPTVAPSLQPTSLAPTPLPSPATTTIDNTANNGGLCCTWDFQICVTAEWCNASAENCSNCNRGFFVMVPTDDACLPRYAGLNDDADGYCCIGLVWVQFSSYIGCGVSGLDGSPMIVPSPQPAESPISTNAPVLTEEDILPLPNGPFVLAGYSERVAIPQPPFPPEGIENDEDAEDCPHRQSDLVSWNDLGLTPSSDNVNVQLPAATKVLVTETISAQLGIVEVPANSELIFDSNPAGIEMRMSGMTIYGKLVAGSERCRISTQITLTLHGSRPSNAVSNVPSAEIKGINVHGGHISLHGKRFYRTWTRLSKTVEPGERVLMLQDAVNWAVGQQIVLVTTALKDSREWHQNEIHEIEYVFPNVESTGAAIQLKDPVQHRHMGFNNYQAEVGLLSRTIKIQGAPNDSEATDIDPLNCQGHYYLGDRARPCGGTQLTGYGGHIIVQSGGLGQLEGVELFRMGQTNLLGRYPIHFHLLGSCPACYVKDSSVHRSFFRCIAMHATNDVLVQENVAYDVTGFCYYLEDGVERKNTLSFNLAAHVHMLGNEPPRGSGQTIPIVSQSNELILPADIAASGFYISNIHNNLIGNTASGGWAGFAFPVLHAPVGVSRDENVRPSSALPLTIDGNTAHSTGWWWHHAGGFYFGGALFIENEVLRYDAGRASPRRITCKTDLCAQGNCDAWCNFEDWEWVRITNTKTFLVAGVGVNSWNGRMEFVGYESHDNALAMEGLDAGFWIDNMLTVCRSGEPLSLPNTAQVNRMHGDGFVWYDTDQEHIITDSTFRNCGYRSGDYDQYDTDPNRGCGDDLSTGCNSLSAVFGFLTHSDQFVPEIMQGTSGIIYEQCGRRFRLRNFVGDGITSVSGRTQNWDDVDGTASGLNVPTIIGSGDPECGLWWKVDDDVIDDPQGPLTFIKRGDGIERGLGHVHLEWDEDQHNAVGGSVCGNGNRAPCPALGYIRHAGSRFANDNGLPVNANADIVGLVGGYGWYLELMGGAPRTLTFSLIEVDPSTPFLFSVVYPRGTQVSITAVAAWCYPHDGWSCEESFREVSSIQDVRESSGNTYHLSSDGVLTLRIVQPAQSYTGLPDWTLPSWSDKYPNSERDSLARFERKNVRLPMLSYGPQLIVEASCAGNGAYCSGSIARSAYTTVDNVCPSGFNQVSYDRCCNALLTTCVYANGSIVSS